MTSATNNGIITGSFAGIQLIGNLNTFTNNGTVTASYGVYNSRVITNFINTSQITGSNYSLSNQGTINALTNSGTLSGNIYNGGRIDTLNNTGTITGGLTMDGMMSMGTLALGVLNNSGSISGDIQVSMIFSGTVITELTNTGSIAGSISVTNIFGGTGIATLNNLQGASTTALTYRGRLPTFYNIIISTPSNYGKLLGSSISGTTTFGISSLSVGSSIVSGTSFASVLSGISNLQLVGGSSGLISSTSNGYTYTLAETMLGSGIWNLTVTSCPGAGCSSGGSSSDSSTSTGSTSSSLTSSSTASPSTTPTPTNVTIGTSIGLSSIGVTANPILAGGTLVLTQGQRSGQTLSILGTGSSITAPTTGAAQLYGVLSGSGKLTFNGSGTTVVSGINTYTGGTVVESGTLSLLGGTLGSGDVYVAPGAQLVGTGSITGPVTVAGLFKPGNSPGYLSTNANVVMTSGSIYQQDIAGTAQANASSPVGATGYYSYLNITGGQFVINAGSTLTPALSNLFNTLESGYGSMPYTPVLGDRFRIVTADGGISGKFSTVTQPAELAAGTQFLPFYNMAGSNSIDLAVIPKSYSATIAVNSGNKNAQSVGAAFDKMVVATQANISTSTQDQLLYVSSTQNAASLPAYAQSLAGEIYAATVAVIAQTTQRVQQAVLTRLGDTMGIGLPNSMTNPAGNTALMAASNTTLSGGVASSAVSTNPAVNPNAEGRAFSNGNVWGDLAYQKGNRSSDSYSGGWNTNLYQLVFGSDYYVSEGFRVGGGIALSSTTLNPTYGSGTIQQGSLFAYGKKSLDVYVVDAMASFGLNSSDLSRGDVTSLSNGFRNKTISGTDAMVSLGLSRPIDLDNFRITPYARVTWQMVTQSSVNEGGAASALSVNGFTGNGVRGVLGVAAGSKATDPMTDKYTYRVYVGVGADSSGVLNPTLNASLAGVATNITTPNAGTTFVQAGLYGTAKVSDNAYAFAGLSGEARSGQTLGAVNVGVRIQF